MKILVAEDDENILNGLCEIFEGEGYTTFKATEGKKALELYQSEKPDLICLDVMMPGMSGYDVCKEIRKKDSSTPVIFITAKSEELDKVLGLEMGADDYIVKPFGVHEVVARIRAVTRRSMQDQDNQNQSEEFLLDDLKVIPSELKARRADDEIDLSLRETKILKLLFDNKNKVIDRNMLLDHCWGEHIVPESRTVDQHISSLRKKVEIDPSDPKIIKTVHGAGYRFEESD